MMTSSMKFEVHNHYGESLTGITFCRTLVYDRPADTVSCVNWKLNIYHPHADALTIRGANDSRSFSWIQNSHSPEVNRVKDCCLSLFGILSAGVERAPLKKDVIFYDSRFNQFDCNVLQPDKQYLLNRFPITQKEVELVKVAANAALNLLINTEEKEYFQLLACEQRSHQMLL